jgi:hypothetical protein
MEIIQVEKYVLSKCCLCPSIFIKFPLTLARLTDGPSNDVRLVDGGACAEEKELPENTTNTIRVPITRKPLTELRKSHWCSITGLHPAA